MLAGDWTAVTSPACNVGKQINLRLPFVDNKINPAMYSKPALFVVNYRGAKPFPTTDNPCGEITYGNRTAENDGIYVGKIDYQQSAKHSLFGRVLLTSAVVPNPWDYNTNLLQDTGYRSGLAGSYTLGSTYLVSSNVIQAFRLSVNRTANRYSNVTPGQLFNWCDAGVKIYCAPEVTRPIMNTIVGGFNLTSGFLTGFVEAIRCRSESVWDMAGKAISLHTSALTNSSSTVRQPVWDWRILCWEDRAS